MSYCYLIPKHPVASSDILKVAEAVVAVRKLLVPKSATDIAEGRSLIRKAEADNLPIYLGEIEVDQYDDAAEALRASDMTSMLVARPTIWTADEGPISYVSPDWSDKSDASQSDQIEAAAYRLALILMSQTAGDPAQAAANAMRLATEANDPTELESAAEALIDVFPWIYEALVGGLTSDEEE